MKWSIRRQKWIWFQRRAACGLAVSCFLGACSSEGSDLVAMYRIAQRTVGAGDRRVTLQEAAAVPFASMGIRFGDGPQSMIILASDSEGNQLWTSAARIAIVTQNGRIVRTSGFDHNLGGHEAGGGTPDGNGGESVRWFADFPDLGLFAVPIACKDRQAGEEAITILGKNIRARRVDESCVATGDMLSWSFKNIYWIDPGNSLVWRSIQHVHPELDAIETEILRPPQ